MNVENRGDVMSSKAQARTPAELSRIAGWRGAAPKSADAFSFVVVGDRCGAHVEGEWAAAIEQVNLLKPAFVICVGDLIEGYTEDQAEINRQWEEFETLTAKLEAPFFYCCGNHDVSNDVMFETYVERHGVDGRSYYSFDYCDCHFVVLDTNTAMRKPDFRDQQLEWLAGELAAAEDAAHLFVIYEIPLLQTGRIWPRLRQLLPPEKTTIFNGHWHALSFYRMDGIPVYILSATGGDVSSGTYEIDGQILTMDAEAVRRAAEAGAVEADRAFGAFRMFAHVVVDDGTPTIALVPLHQILPADYTETVMNARTAYSKQVHSLNLPDRGYPWPTF